MQKASTRRRKAYWVALKVGFSYLWLYLNYRIRGLTYWKSRIRKINRLNAERVKDVMLELQGLFIKVGQLISIMSNVLPIEFREPLEELQDNVPPHPFSEMAAVIEEELGEKVDKLFTTVEQHPIAAASIGQVHRATIGDQAVIIKIQHPHIDELAHVDLSIIQKIISIVARFMDIKGIEHVYQQVEQMIDEELDYLQEAQSMKHIKSNMARNRKFYVPKVYENYCSKKVLVAEFCEGVKISNLKQLRAWGHDFEELTDTLVEGYCQMVLADGFYHADPHPGNVFVNEEGQVILLDFGAVALLSQEMKEGIPLLLECIIKQDTEEMVKVLRKLGFIAYGDDATKIAEKLIDSIQDFVYNDLQLENLNVQNLSAEQIARAFQLINIREMTKIMQIPKDWVLLNRAVTLVQGIAFLLCPNWNPVEALQPYIRQYIIGQEGGSFTDMLLNTLKSQLNAATTIPLELQKALRKTNQGKLQVEVKEINDQLSGLRGVGQQLVWLLLFIASVYFFTQIDSFAYPLLVSFFQLTSIVSFVLFLWNVTKPKGK